MTKYSTEPAGDKPALRQTGLFEVHPEGCGCRRCRRNMAGAYRARPRYGQQPARPAEPAGQPRPASGGDDAISAVLDAIGASADARTRIARLFGKGDS